ncbi:putative Elongation factor Tu domain 2 [Prochlorococcus sp. MIT 0602]|uniref:DUF3804 family protein n=1 Tax=unclassified Prochlorococcus TaxID=2627481 RepID=UPI0005339B57|nr:MULTISPECIES: DUF3804 family protein [unclassified Prochlorococcus]KGG14845.1 putative Elongation factor Tu domain 2 [Prochlorococcus sp. MIT 0602]
MRSFKQTFFKTLPSDSQQIQALITGFANRAENKSFLTSNVTEDFLAIRPSGNPITAEGLIGMYNNADLVVELSELVKIHRLEANSDWGFSAFTLKEAFSYKGEQNNDLSSYSMIFKKVDGTWKIFWMQRSSGNTDLSTWD